MKYVYILLPKCGRRNAEVQVTCMGVVTGGDVQGRHHRSGIVTGLALSDEPTFHNVFRLTVKTEVGQKIRSHFINKQTSSFWPLSSLTWCCALLLHKKQYRTVLHEICVHIITEKKTCYIRPTIVCAPYEMPP